jgi:hypothetical protein
MAVCEADNEVSRIKEELRLLPKEMQAHVQFYRDLESKLTQLQTVLAADSTPTLEGLQAAGFSTLLGIGRYQPTAESVLSSAGVRSGAVSFVRVAQIEVQEQLRVAAKAFAGVVVGVEGAAEQLGDELDGDADSEDGDMAAPSDCDDA